MEKLVISREKSFDELDLENFNKMKFSVYLIDFKWHYLFVNDFVKQTLGERGKDLDGKNLWDTFAELAEDLSFMQMKTDMETGKAVNFITTSPVTGQRLKVNGYSLKDCYLFYTSILPKKDELLNELRTAMAKPKQ